MEGVGVDLCDLLWSSAKELQAAVGFVVWYYGGAGGPVATSTNMHRHLQRTFELRRLLHGGCDMRCYSTRREPGCHTTVQVRAFFSLQGTNMAMDVAQTQMMRCIICHPHATSSDLSASSSTSSSRRSTTRSRKGFVQNNPAHGSTSMKKHLVNDHGVDWEWYRRERKAEEATIGEGKQKSKKRLGVAPSSITEYFGGSDRGYLKNDHAQVCHPEN